MQGWARAQILGLGPGPGPKIGAGPGPGPALRKFWGLGLADCLGPGPIFGSGPAFAYDPTRPLAIFYCILSYLIGVLGRPAGENYENVTNMGRYVCRW